MRWSLSLVFFALLGGCQCGEPAPPAQAPVAEGAAQAETRDVRDGPRKRPRKDGRRDRRSMVFGAPGEVPASLILGARAVGDGTRTIARLELKLPEGKSQRVPLGAVPGACENIEPVEVGEHRALWSVRCVAGEVSNDISVVQIDQTVAVMRLEAGAEDWRPVRRVRLVEGTQLLPEGPAQFAAVERRSLRSEGVEMKEGAEREPRVPEPSKEGEASGSN